MAQYISKWDMYMPEYLQVTLQVNVYLLRDERIQNPVKDQR